MRHWAIDPSNNNEENTQYERHRGWKRYSFQEGHKNILTFFFFSTTSKATEREFWKGKPVINVPTNENIHLYKEGTKSRSEGIPDWGSTKCDSKKGGEKFVLPRKLFWLFHCSDRTVNVCNDQCFVAGIIVQFFYLKVKCNSDVCTVGS